MKRRNIVYIIVTICLLLNLIMLGVWIILYLLSALGLHIATVFTTEHAQFVVSVISCVVALTACILSSYQGAKMLSYQEKDQKYNRKAIENKIRNSFQVKKIVLHKYLIAQNITDFNVLTNETELRNLELLIIFEVEELYSIDKMSLDDISIMMIPLQQGQNEKVKPLDIRISSNEKNDLECLSATIFQRKIITNVKKDIYSAFYQALKNDPCLLKIKGKINLWTNYGATIEIKLDRKLYLDTSLSTAVKWVFKMKDIG